eukprot:XP_017952482.1 PREDICTED: zinc-alpha-2-glycoprotein-like isoform X2 [Xenopus tropicalis]
MSVVYCGSHLLQYHITRLTAPSPGLPELIKIGYVDGLRYARCTSETHRCEFLIPALETVYERMTLKEKCINYFEFSQFERLQLLTDIYNKTSGNDAFHIYQMKFGCVQHDDGTTGIYQEVAFDSKELITYDKHTGTFIPTSQEARIVAQLWNKNYAKVEKIYMENCCTPRLALFPPAIASDLEKKVPPKVKVSSSESDGEQKLHCRVYGFYPRDVEVKWIKNGRDEIHSEEAAQILPNPDGTYQIRVSVGVTPEEGATYSCHIDHSSLENPLVVPFESKNGIHLYIIIPVCAPLLLLLIILGICIYRKRMTQDPKGSYQSGSAS